VRFLALLAKVLLSMALTLALVDIAVRLILPREPRLEDNFSAAYLQRAIRGDGLARKTVFVGDSALWGYRVAVADAALTRLSRAGAPVENLSFEGGSVANSYALLRVLDTCGVRPKAFVFNVNLKEFNTADNQYRTLYPALEQLVWNDLSPVQRAVLAQTQKPTLDARIDRALSGVWALYGMRSDIREMLFGSADAAGAVAAVTHGLSGESARYAVLHKATPNRFLGTYNLAALTDANVEVLFLRELGARLGRERIPAYAILTPTNHRLLHDYIDVPEYDAQLSLVRRILVAQGITVLNYDRAFASSEFLDNDHLTAAGNAHLATLLRRDLPL